MTKWERLRSSAWFGMFAGWKLDESLSRDRIISAWLCRDNLSIHMSVKNGGIIVEAFNSGARYPHLERCAAHAMRGCGASAIAFTDAYLVDDADCRRTLANLTVTTIGPPDGELGCPVYVDGEVVGHVSYDHEADKITGDPVAVEAAESLLSVDGRRRVE